ncbi:hypothetical protein R6Q59_013703 [Mikania micrantha]
MAGEEITRPASLPPYTEMILAAIDSLKQKDGSSASSISNYIESACGSLPDDHTNILTDQLNKLVHDGELVVVNNNYLRLDTSVPVKRGRGRPPKAKDPSAIQSPTSADASAAEPPSAEPGSEVKRGRGRPKKDPNAPSAPKKVKVASVPTPPSSTGRPRGRPRKVRPELAGVEAN